ncbi:Hypothetical protein D9617_1g087170 [Elsinoe fawcettii]|nr:Hypothetical protein D9617_1g087170 [Elsinoe fawcettii]
MTVLSGEATIRFGVADTSEDMRANTWGGDHEAEGIEVRARKGDVFLIPAGVAHKSYAPVPDVGFLRLTEGDGHSIGAENPEKFLREMELSGFVMMGAYPVGAEWDFVEREDDPTEWRRVWSVGRPESDPVLGNSLKGIRGLWRDGPLARL